MNATTLRVCAPMGATAALFWFAGSWLVLIGGLAALGWRFSDPASWGFAGVLAASVGPLPFAGLVWALSRGRNV